MRLLLRLLSQLPRRFSASLCIFTNAPLATAVGLFLCFFVGFADGVLMPFFALWAEKDAGISASHIGLLLACYSGGELLATLIMELAPAHARATYMAAASVAADLKDTLGPAAGTSLYAVAARLPWMVGIPVAVCATLALAFNVRRHGRRMAS